MSRPRFVEPPGTRSLRVLGAGLVALAPLLGAGAAMAASPCKKYEQMSETLERQYAEVPVGGGLASTGKLVQVFAAKDGATWTVVLTQPNGMSCIVASGRYWQAATPKDGPQV
jgi:hypothetical protein